MPANLYIFMGLIASGKSSVAQAFANKFSFPYFNSDIVRKELAGKSPRSRQGDVLNQGIYTPEFSRLTYDALLDHAQESLCQNQSVVLDGSYHKKSERKRAVLCAERCNCPVLFILCQCGDAETRSRLDKRALDPDAVSDGNWQIYQKQKEFFENPEELSSENLLILNTEKTVPELLDLLCRNLPQK